MNEEDKKQISEARLALRELYNKYQTQLHDVVFNIDKMLEAIENA